MLWDLLSLKPEKLDLGRKSGVPPSCPPPLPVSPAHCAIVLVEFHQRAEIELSSLFSSSLWLSPQRILQPTFHDLHIFTLQLAWLFCFFSPFNDWIFSSFKKKEGGGGEREEEESGGMCGGEAEGCCSPSPLLWERIHYTIDTHGIYIENRVGITNSIL